MRVIPAHGNMYSVQLFVIKISKKGYMDVHVL